MGNLGIAYTQLGELPRAIECHERDLNIAREIGTRRGESGALGNLGIAYRQLGQPRRAIEYFEQNLDIAREIGDQRDEGTALWNWALALNSLGQRDEAISKADAALVSYEQIERPGAAKVRAALEEWRAKGQPTPAPTT